MSEAKIYLLGLGVLVFLVVLLFSAIPSNPLDATDNHVTGSRSGMRILVDHGTGCQYLRATGGGLTPRLDAQGKPICGVKA